MVEEGERMTELEPFINWTAFARYILLLKKTVDNKISSTQQTKLTLLFSRFINLLASSVFRWEPLTLAVFNAESLISPRGVLQ